MEALKYLGEVTVGEKLRRQSCILTCRQVWELLGPFLGNWEHQERSETWALNGEEDVLSNTNRTPRRRKAAGEEMAWLLQIFFAGNSLICDSIKMSSEISALYSGRFCLKFCGRWGKLANVWTLHTANTFVEVKFPCCSITFGQKLCFNLNQSTVQRR